MHPCSGRISEDAVSPVIGTLLILAITIVLIAVICGVALGFFSGMFSAKNVGATLTPYETTNEYGMEFLMYSGADAQNITSVRVLAGGVTFACNGASSVKNPQIGVSYRFNVTGVTAGVLGNNVIVTAVGTFADGEEVVLVQTRMTVLGDGNSDVVLTDKGYLKVLFGTYSNSSNDVFNPETGVIPGRGVYVQIQEILKPSEVGTVTKFKVDQPSGVTLATPGEGRNLKDVVNPATKTKYYFYAVLATSQYPDSPYQERSENPEIPNLKLKGTFTLTSKDDTASFLDEVHRQSVKLEARQVIFSIPEIVAGTVTPLGSNAMNVTITTKTLTGTTQLEVWVVPGGSDEDTSAYRVYSDSVPNGARKIQVSDSRLSSEDAGAKVDVLVKKASGSRNQWSAWYRVGSTTVGALRG